MKNIFYGWWIVFACFVIAFYISGAVTIGFTAFFEPIVKEFGWSYTEVSFAASLRGLELGIFAPIMGYLVDRFGARILIFSGTISIGAGYLLLSQMSSLTLFYLAFILIGLGTSSCTGTVLTPAVANWFRRDVGKALGLMAAGFGFGGLLIPLITLLIKLYHWRTTFIILGVGMWLLGIPISFLIRRRPEEFGFFPDGLNGEESIKIINNDKDINVREALRHKIFWYLSLSESIRLMAMTAVITHIMPYFESEGMAETTAVAITSLIPLLSIIGRIFFGWLGDKYSRTRILAVAYAFTGIGLIAFSYARNFWCILIFMLFFPFSWGAGPLRGSILRNFFGRASLGKILGLMAGIGTFARMMGPLLAGLTYDTNKDYKVFWLLCASTLSVAVILMLSVRPLENNSDTF